MSVLWILEPTEALGHNVNRLPAFDAQSVPFPWPTILTLLGLFAIGGAAYVLLRFQTSRPKKASPFPEEWDIWERAISEALFRHRVVRPDMLTDIPPQAGIHAIYRYYNEHKDLALLLEEKSASIKPARQYQLQVFVDNWHSLLARMHNTATAAPLAARLTEQLCELLGFSPLNRRVFKSQVGYMVEAATLRLSLPSRFPIIFLLQERFTPEDIRDVRNFMSALGALSFFALLVVMGDETTYMKRSKKLLALVKEYGGADDFIVLHYRDLCELFLAADPVLKLISTILEQVDLTVVSPYVISGPVPENMFFGRDHEIKAILRSLRDRSFAIIGGRKIGKTSLLAKVERLLRQTPGLAPIRLDCQHVLDHESFYEMLSVTTQVAFPADSREPLRRAVIRLRRKMGGRTIVFLLDEVDNLLTYDIRHKHILFSTCRALAQEGLCRFLLCGERVLYRQLHNPSSPLFNWCNTLRLSYLLPQDARRIITEPMETMGISFEDEHIPNEILEISTCHPNLVQAICQMLITSINDRGDRYIRLADLERVRESAQFREFYLEVTWGDATALERLITVLMSERERFSPSEVEEALEREGISLPTSHIRQALEGLELFSILKREGNTWRFAARAFPQFMRESDLATSLCQELIDEVKRAEQISSNT